MIDLSEFEIQNVMLGEFDDSNLVSHWSFDNPVDNSLIAYDLSGNGFHGNLEGGASFSSDIPSIVEDIYGCTDSLADNYNTEANSDDGNCSYPDNGDYSLIFDGFGAQNGAEMDPCWSQFGIIFCIIFYMFFCTHFLQVGLHFDTIFVDLWVPKSIHLQQSSWMRGLAVLTCFHRCQLQTIWHGFRRTHGTSSLPGKSCR